MLYKKLFLLITNILYHTNMNRTSENGKFGKNLPFFQCRQITKINIATQFKNGI